VRGGLADVQVEVVPIVLRDPTALDNALGLRDWATFAHEQGLINAVEVHAWDTALDEDAATGSFFYSFSLLITADAGRYGLPDGLLVRAASEAAPYWRTTTDHLLYHLPRLYGPPVASQTPL